MPCLVRQTKVSVKSTDEDGEEDGGGLQIPFAEFRVQKLAITKNNSGSGDFTACITVQVVTCLLC